MQNGQIKNNLFDIKNDIFSNEISTLFQEPGNSPLILVDDFCNIIYSSDSFKKVFKLTDKKKFFDIWSDKLTIPVPALDIVIFTIYK